MTTNTWPKIFQVSDNGKVTHYVVLFRRGSTYRVEPDATVKTPASAPTYTLSPITRVFDMVVRAANEGKRANETDWGLMLNINQVPANIALHIKKVVEKTEYTWRDPMSGEPDKLQTHE